MKTFCDCPSGPGRTISDPIRHAAWHALVIEQGIAANVVDVVSLQRGRGLQIAAVRGDAGQDEKARKRAFTALRRRAIAVLT